MKFISLFVFTAALWGSWYVAHRTLPVAETVHQGIQEDLRVIIADYIKKNVEGAEDVRFERMWTETLSDKKVKAQFLYSFIEPQSAETQAEEGVAGKARVEIDGYAILNKTSDSAEKVEFSFDELHILNNAITFDEPLKITAGETDGKE